MKDGMSKVLVDGKMPRGLYTDGGGGEDGQLAVL